jgi:hypothetical protein
MNTLILQGLPHPRSWAQVHNNSRPPHTQLRWCRETRNFAFWKTN